MCGIAGFFDRSGAAGRHRAGLLREMTRTLVHRGPDDEGYFLDDFVGLGHRRLSIIDLSTGQQPIANEDNSVWVILNGEIYNYEELRKELKSKGHVFRTRTDTEVIVHAWEQWDVGCVDRFFGMFAFAVWDQPQRQLFLARDRLGKKPLYFAEVGDSFVFGSEIKALLPVPGLDRELDLEAVSDYLSLNYTPAPRTTFRHVRKLPAGHYLVVDPNGVKERKYWDLSFAPQVEDEASAVKRLRELLEDSVRIRLRSDVPLGAFLSGGLDSSAVVGLMAGQLPGPVVTSSIGFPDDEFDELPFARQVAERFGTSHYENVVTPDAFEVLDKLVWHYDEPFADSSAVPTYYVSKLARSQVTVALSGDGGDENFAGYRRYYFDVRENRVRGLVPGLFRRPLFGALGALYPKGDYLPQVFRGKAFLSNVGRTPWGAYFHSVSGIDQADKERLLGGDCRTALGGYDSASLFEHLHGVSDGPDSLARIQYIDFKTYLPEDILAKVDRASMAHSLEVRCPLLDHRLVEYAAGLPSSMKLRGANGKLVFKEAVADLLPASITDRTKMGFAVPIGSWLRRDLASLVEEHVLQGSRSHGLFSDRVLKKWWQEHRTGLRDRTTGLWAILMFNLWYERFGKRPHQSFDADVRVAATGE